MSVNGVRNGAETLDRGRNLLEKSLQKAPESQPAGAIGGAPTNLLRVCAKCGEEKALSQFGKFHRGPGGLNHKCVDCCRQQGKEWRAANREHANSKSREWKLANPETRKKVTKAYRDANKGKIAAQAKTYCAANPEKMVKRSKEYYESNREKCAEASRLWGQKNPEKVLAKGRAWGLRNPEKINAKCSRRRAKLSAVAWADRKALANIYRAARDISKATGVDHQVDHVYPLNGLTVSGLHVPENLMVVETWTNRSKHNKLPGHLAHELWSPLGSDVYYGDVSHG